MTPAYSTHAERTAHDELIDRIFDLFRTRGDMLYGEEVTERMHALQCGSLAIRQGCTPTLIAASLLHDIGHLLHDLGEDIADRGVDARHEDIGWNWLKRWFPPAVTEPVRLHVAAKRYLCAADPAYQPGLSPSSLHSLHLQGGPMSEQEVREFEQGPFWQDAVTLRRFDDHGKDPSLHETDLEVFRPALLRSLRGAEPSAAVHEEHEE
jgi:phosphonate degradation associated HDIG domain protein